MFFISSLRLLRQLKAQHQQIEALSAQVTHLTEMLQQMHTLLQASSLPDPAPTGAETHYLAFAKNTIYERNNFIDFKKVPLYEALAQSLFLVKTLEKQSVQVHKIFSNFSVLEVDDWYSGTGVLDILVLGTWRQNKKVAFVFKCLEDEKSVKEELSDFERSDYQDRVEQYLLSVLPEYEVAYALAFKEQLLRHIPFNKVYLYFNLKRDGCIEALPTELWQHWAHKKQKDKGYLEMPVVSDEQAVFLQRGVDFDFIKQLLVKRSGGRLVEMKRRVLLARRKKTVLWDALYYIEHHQNKVNLYFIFKIVPTLRLPALYKMKEQMLYYDRAIKKEFSGHKKIFRKMQIIPVLLYHYCAQDYVLQEAETMGILCMRHDREAQRIEDLSLYRKI